MMLHLYAMREIRVLTVTLAFALIACEAKKAQAPASPSVASATATASRTHSCGDEVVEGVVGVARPREEVVDVHAVHATAAVEASSFLKVREGYSDPVEADPRRTE